MAITLFTGVPGAGKTLRSIFDALALKGEGRQVFHIGIDGMDPDIIPVSPFSLEDWKKLPAGSVLVVDEAHKFLPVRSPGKPPDWIQDLTEIRHFGIELFLVTQDPRNIDSFVRRLVGVHKHMTRKAGLKGAMVRTFQGISEDPNDFTNRQSSEQVPWLYPKHLFQVYKSASLHVVKPKIPKKILFAVLLFVACAITIPAVVYSVSDTVSSLDEKDNPSQQSEVVLGKKPSAPAFGFSQEKEDPWSSPEAFVKALTPLVPGIPWSAPIYAGKKPLSHPRLLCIASGFKGASDRTCRCYTEQATLISGIPSAVCEAAVEGGVYDPFLPPLSSQAGSASHGGAPAPVSVTPITQ